MKLAIDFVNTRLGSGTKTYNLNLVRQISKVKTNDIIYIFISKSYFNKLGKIKNKNLKIVIKPDFLSNTLFRIAWMQIIFPLELKFRNINKLFSPMNICPIILRFSNIKIYLGLHSNLPWKYFHLMPGSLVKKYFTKKMMEWSIKCCNTLIVDSFFAKNEIINLLDINRKKVKVVYLGYNHKKNKLKKNNQNYFLSVLSCVKYHNIINLLSAYKDIKVNYDIKYYLVLQVLDKSYYLKIKNFITENKLNDKVKIFTNLQSSRLPQLYKNSRFYIFTSYCEVFGLTTLEAMSYGCPVLVSNKSALPEINGNAAIYFNPDNILQIKNKIIQIIENKKLRKKKKIISIKHLKKFSWEKSAVKTLKIIEVL
jgi:glycosyltransferase involved in cell wall biosynthesis